MIRSRVVYLTIPLALATVVAACSRTAERAPATAAAAAAPAVDLQAIAQTLVAAAMIHRGDKVMVSGGVRDWALLQDIAIETMKAGGDPLITMGSDQLARRSYDEVPASYDSLPQTFGLGLVSLTDAQILVEASDSDNVFAGVPAARMAMRGKMGQPINQAFLRRGVRLVDLGNGLYPTAQLATRLGRPQAQVADMFWKAVAVPPDSLRAKGAALLAGLAGARRVTLTAANGTNISFGVTAARGFVSDGALTADKVKQGGSAAETWLPAGELLVPVALGTADGTVVVDKYLFQGAMIDGLTLTFAKGKLTDMTAKSGIDALRALYDASSGGKDMFSYIDLGLNPAMQLPTNTGRIVWMAAGGVTVGMGDNTGWGGTNVSTFGLAAPVSGATLAVDGRELISGGVLK
jgi:leucyl aminopeptidase (aminopeptidase T)